MAFEDALNRRYWDGWTRGVIFGLCFGAILGAVGETVSLWFLFVK